MITKEIFLKDLCARLPYGVKVGFNKEGDVFTPIKFDLQTKELFAEDRVNNCICIFRYDIFQPYLRSPDNLTEEENNWLDVLSNWSSKQPFLCAFDSANVMEYIYSHHVDYLGLIKVGMALEAPEGMYKIN